MLPKPFINFIPKFFRRDEKLIAFADKHDELMDSFQSDTLGLNNFIDPFQAPSVILDYLGDYLAADLRSKDSEREKRKKIYNAVKGHKTRGLWADDIKPAIDLITGLDSELFSSEYSDDAIFLGDGTED